MNRFDFLLTYSLQKPPSIPLPTSTLFLLARSLPIGNPHMVFLLYACNCFRAHKLAATDDTTLNHIRNIYHMHRRMDETDRRQFKSALKQECQPHDYKRSNRESLAFSLTSWIPR